MALEKIKKFFVEEEEMLEEFENEVFIRDDKKNVQAFKQMVGTGSHLVLTEPRAFSEAQSIADHIKSKRAVVVNLQRVTSENAKRIIDFLSGTVYALDGEIKKIGDNNFLCTPNNINVAGEISNQTNSNPEEIKKKW